MTGHCYYCRSILSTEIQQRNHMCPSCGTDIHCCRNCTHFDESLGSRCKEPNTPWIKDDGVQNQCELFEFRSDATTRRTPTDEASSESEKAKEAFRALFRNA